MKGEDLCYLCGDEEEEASLWCRVCTRGAHPGCLGLRERDSLGKVFTCHSCLAADADLSLEGAGVMDKMATIMKEIELGCREGLEESSRATYSSNLNFLWKYAESAFPGERQASRKVLMKRKRLPDWLVLGAVLARAKTGAKATVDGLVAAIRKFHDQTGKKCVLDSPWGKELVRAAKKRAKKGRGTKAPLQPDLVGLMVAFLEWRAEEELERERKLLLLRNAAITITGFCALLRKSELSGLRRGDVWPRSDVDAWVVYVKMCPRRTQGGERGTEQVPGGAGRGSGRGARPPPVPGLGFQAKEDGDGSPAGAGKGRDTSRSRCWRGCRPPGSCESE